MNKRKMDILNILHSKSYINQRVLSELSGYSLGKVNQSLRELQEEGFLNSQMELTVKAYQYIDDNKPQNAIILAAGFGMRMVPINMEVPKGLLLVKDEALVERIISQLHEVGIKKITIVVGFMKESYEYLIDKYHVELKVNMEYTSKNNLHSLSMVSDLIFNTYIIPCDIWCAYNPFQRVEMYSWYMVSNIMNAGSNVRVNRKDELVKTLNGGNQMVGIAYISGKDAIMLQKNLVQMDSEKKYDNCFWEEALFRQEKMYVAAKVVSGKKVFEINTYEQLRDLDINSSQLKSDAINVITETFQVKYTDILDIKLLKKGMTNRSFLFMCKNQRYIMRIPGEGTENLINRKEEYEVYQAIKKVDLCEDVLYISADTGYKITKYFDAARVCNAYNWPDVEKSMKKLREFHELGLKVDHMFDIFKQINFYESLWKNSQSCYRDYTETKTKVFQLKTYIDMQPKCWTLTHIDAVPDNFLFVKNGEEEEVRIIDWEYAGMQDSCVDIAMFAIYSLYDREEVDRLIDTYYPEGCERKVRLKIYCYIAVCGLLWSNWCEYKRQLGVEFGEYSLKQYRYAKEYYKIFQEEKKCEV